MRGPTGTQVSQPSIQTICKFGETCEYKHDPEKEAKHNVIVKSCETEEVLSSTGDDSFDEIKEDIPSNKNDSLLNNEHWTEFSCEKCEYTAINNRNLKRHVKSIHEESYVHNKEQLENIEMEQANTKKRKYGNDTLTSTESV